MRLQANVRGIRRALGRTLDGIEGVYIRDRILDCRRHLVGTQDLSDSVDAGCAPIDSAIRIARTIVYYRVRRIQARNYLLPAVGFPCCGLSIHEDLIMLPSAPGI